MNRRLCVWVGSIFTCVALVGTAVAQALPGGAPGDASTPAPAAAPAAATGGPVIPPQAETATDATPFAPAIRAFIQYQVNLLQGTDYAAQTAARDALRKTLTRGSTSSYYAVYCKEWGAACTAILTKNPPPALGTRLNIGIVTAVLTDNGQTMDSPALPAAESLVELLLNDSSPSVSLWGVKAAGPLVMLRAQMPDVGGRPAIKTSQLVAAIVSAVKKHKASDIAGFLTQDAYTVLAIEQVPALSPAQVKALQPPLVDPILDILEVRVGQYSAGPIQSPGAERRIATFLSTQYPNVQPPVQRRIVQLLVNLEAYAGQRSDQYINSRPELSQMRETLKYVASALKVIANDKSVDTALSWLSAIPPASTPPEIFAHTKQVPAVIKAVFSWLTTPPEIPAMDPPALIKPPTAPAAGGAAPASGGGSSPPPR